MSAVDAEDIHMGRIDEYTKDEWRVITRKIRPDWTEEKFDQEWARFIATKASKQKQ